MLGKNYKLHRIIDVVGGFTADADVMATQTTSIPILELINLCGTSKLDIVLSLFMDNASTAVPPLTPTFTYSIQPINVIDEKQKIYARQAVQTTKNQWDVVTITNLSRQMLFRISAVTTIANPQPAGTKLGVFYNYLQ